MTPPLFQSHDYQYYFFARDDKRMHIHVSHPDGTAKFWLEPEVALAWHTGLSSRQLREAERFIGEHLTQMRQVWRTWLR
jgi:hypothetical protein